MNISSSNLITSSNPLRFQTGVLTNASLYITFLRDMNTNTFTDATIALEVIGTIARVPITHSYTNRILTITPISALLPNESYALSIVGDINPQNDMLTNNITGIQDIIGDGMDGIFTLEFTTSSTATPSITIAQLPIAQSAITNQPTFSWEMIAADYFEIQVSNSNSFENIYWPIQTDVIGLITSSVITPNRPFEINAEYWWRVRGVMANTKTPSSSANSGTPIVGPWSSSVNFYYGDPNQGSIEPEDTPFGFPSNPTSVTVLSTNPPLGTSNLKIYPTSITVKLSGLINNNIANSNFSISGEPVDGNYDISTFAPIFVPSLNGSQFGSGGIDYPGPVDTYQEIKSAGSYIGNPSASASTTISNSVSASITTLNLPVSSSYFKDNNVYTITLDLPELPAPLTWTFTSKWTPIFSSARSVRQWTDFILAEITNDQIYYKIRHNSLYALMIQVYPPTQLDGQSWIYQPPVSFNISDPPYFVRKYVELKTAYDFLMSRFWMLLGQGGRTTLGDFTVDRQMIALKENLKLAIEQIKEQILPFEDKLHGHSNRSYARAQWSVRNGGIFGGANSTSTPQGREDHSYLWPRTSRRQF